MTQNRVLPPASDPPADGDAPGPRAVSVAVTSGKGGVGKTNLSLNLAIELSRIGRRVLLVDADLGLANVDILLGITPKVTLEAVLRGECTIFDATVEGPEGLTLIPAASGIGESEAWRTGDREALLDDLARLERGFDLILIDTGAGISPKVTDFVVAADQALVVAAPEPTSIADAYAMVKVVLGMKPDLRAGLVVNRARSSREAYDVHAKFQQIVSRFLNTSVANRGHVLEDTAVEQAVRTQCPFVLGSPRSPSARCIAAIAREFSGTSPAPVAAPGLFRRLLGRRPEAAE
jgi:flagellar biosynthesis protein FlhG